MPDGHGKPMARSRRAIGVRRRRSASIRPASSISGTVSGRDTRMPHSSGTGEIRLESVDRAAGYFTTRSAGAEVFHARTSGIYLRADPADAAVLDGIDASERAALIMRRLEEWSSLANS